jgi:hypothetical protein
MEGMDVHTEEDEA